MLGKLRLFKTIYAIEYSVYKGLAIFSQPQALFKTFDYIIPFTPYIIRVQAISTEIEVGKSRAALLPGHKIVLR
jgi:hypothetical protein